MTDALDTPTTVPTATLNRSMVQVVLLFTRDDSGGTGVRGLTTGLASLPHGVTRSQLVVIDRDGRQGGALLLCTQQ